MATLNPIQIIREFVEHPGWQQKHPIGPVTWDGWCSLCGFPVEDKDFSGGVSITGNGRRLARVEKMMLVNGETFRSEEHMIVCSQCCPKILKGT